MTCSHLASFSSHPPLHGLIEHEVHSWVEDQDERRQCAVPQHSHTLSGYDLSKSICEGHTEAGQADRRQETSHTPSKWKVLPTKYASVVGLMKVFIPELCPLKLQSSVDHPHGSGEDHIDGPFRDNTWVTILIPFYRIHMELYYTHTHTPDTIPISRSLPGVDPFGPGIISFFSVLKV